MAGINAASCHAAASLQPTRPLIAVAFFGLIRHIEHTLTGLEANLLTPLAAEGTAVSIVSMPCQELFEEQALEYRLSIFPEGVPVLSVEASGVRGWEKYAHMSVGMTRYGASGPIKAVYPKFGFTVENIAAQAKNLLAFYGGKPAPSLINRPVNTFQVTGH